MPHCEISDSLLARAGRKPLDLEIIERVYEAAWAQFEARRPFRNTEADDERQETLRKQVMKIASEGKVEFDTVYEKVVAECSSRRPPSRSLRGWTRSTATKPGIIHPLRPIGLSSSSAWLQGLTGPSSNHCGQR